MHNVAVRRSAQEPLTQRLIVGWQKSLNRLRSRLVKSLRFRFALALTLLVSCVVILSVFVGVVPDRKAERIESRIQVAEAVATLSSILLREGDPTGFRNSLQFIVERNPDIHAVVLKRDAGDDVRFSAAVDEKYSLGTIKTDVVHVPLLRQKQQWGELLVHFVSGSNEPWQKRLMQARWSAVLFIPLASFVLFLLLPGKVLQALMRARTISSVEELAGYAMRTEAAAKRRPGFPGKWFRAMQKARDAKDERARAGKPQGAVRPARILVVDDSEENRHFLSIVLRDMGHEVVLAEHGRQALQAMFDEGQGNNRFDMVLMNVHMAVMNGYTAVKEMRLRGVRGVIVALASSASPDAQAKALAAGYTHFLAKPIDLDKMIALVDSLSAGVTGTRQSRESDAILRSGQSDLGADDARFSSYADGNHPRAAAHSKQSALSGVPGSTQRDCVPVFSKLPVAQPFFYRISGSYVKSLPVKLDELRRAVVENKIGKAAQIAATIKCAAVKAGYPGFSELCKPLQMTGSDAERDIARSVKELESYAGRVIAGWHQTGAPRVAVQNSQFTATIRARSTA
ncbi:MAG: response regulator [Granulosicoccus sp.]